MTENQENLLRFISAYRIKYCLPPTLQEMAKGIRVSDHKSVSGILSALTRQGYIERRAQKHRSTLLTDSALEFLGVPLFQRQRLEEFDCPYFKREVISSSSEMVASPVSENVSNGKNSLKTDGTNLADDLRTIVGNTVTDIATKISANQETGAIFSWGLLLTGLTAANIILIGNGTSALYWAGAGAVIVKLLSK